MLSWTQKMATAVMMAVFSISIAIEGKGETVLEEIQRTGVIRVGIRNDAIPFGYRKPNGEYTGYCLDFIAALKDQIGNRLERDALLVRIFQSTASNRFRLVEDGIVHLECGPNTIREELPNEGIIFSRAFFLTGTQFLILESNRDRVNLDGSLAEARIAVLRGTTTEQLVEERYPLARIVRLQGATGRLRGAQGVLQGRFDTFVSDGILLVGEAEALSLGNVNYALIPEVPLSCDFYGMILPEDSQWASIVNSTIESDRGAEIWEDWFEVILPRIEATSRACDRDETEIELLPQRNGGRSPS